MCGIMCKCASVHSEMVKSEKNFWGGRDIYIRIGLHKSSSVIIIVLLGTCQMK